MAQVCGIQNHNRMASPIIPLSHVGNNKFTTEEGVEFVLHELEPNSGNYDSGTSSRTSMKKRGRPRKDAIREMENCQSTFNIKESEISEEKLRKKREKRERKERKEREKLRKLCLDNPNDSTPKKRGRPRKESTAMPSTDRLIDYHSSSNTDTLTPPYSELSEESVVGECAMMEMLNLDQELFPVNQEEQSLVGLSDSFELNYNWSPIQRLMQLNQALAFTNMYKDFIFWDRIIAEFMLPSVTLRLEFGTEKSFDLPFLVASKMFWIFSQIGLHRIHFLHTGITEKLSERDEGGVLFNSSDAFVYTHLYSDERLMIQHRTNQLIEFDSKSKISKWTIRFVKCEEFWKSTEDKTHVEEFLWGLPKRVFEFLDVALVMNSVLPDPSSWLTWFYIYIHQNGLKNFSVVELSRPPSPFKFPVLTDEVTNLSQDNLGNMEFFDNGRDFIFSVLNSTATENINFDGAVNDLLVEAEQSPLEVSQTEAPFEELFEKQAEELYPELTEYPEFKDEQIIMPAAVNECFTEHFEPEDEHIFENTQSDNVQDSATEILDDSQLVVEISDANTSETDSDSDDFFDSYS